MLVSVITPTIDSAVFVDEAILSIPRNEGAKIEHIIVHDGSDAFGASLETRHQGLTILRGPNRGPTAAVEVGIRAASGEFLLWLNSDDKLLPGSIARLVACATARPDILVWTGGTRIVSYIGTDQGKVARIVARPDTTALTLPNILDDLPLLTARFCHRSVFERVGNVDPRFSQCSDREFLIRVAIAGIADAPLGTMISELRMHEGSLTIHRKKHWVPPYLAEHMAIADAWSGRSTLTRSKKALFRRWRARELFRLAIALCRAGKTTEALSLIAREVVRDPRLILRVTTSYAAWRRRRRNG
jgi:GT2 family glycosyltransferase